MPIYEYRCTACRHELEAIQKFADAPLLTCPQCGQATLTKLVSAAGFQLKGSGWYQTDFRGSGGKPAGKPDAEAGSAKAAEGAKADATPAASAEAAPAKADTSSSPVPTPPTAT